MMYGNIKCTRIKDFIVKTHSKEKLKQLGMQK